MEFPTSFRDNEQRMQTAWLWTCCRGIERSVYTNRVFQDHEFKSACIPGGTKHLKDLSHIAITKELNHLLKPLFPVSSIVISLISDPSDRPDAVLAKDSLIDKLRYILTNRLVSQSNKYIVQAVETASIYGHLHTLGINPSQYFHTN